MNSSEITSVDVWLARHPCNLDLTNNLKQLNINY